MIWFLTALAFAGSLVAAMRWLRVAQREHYLTGVIRFARIWWTVDVWNTALAIGLVATVVLSVVAPPIGIIPIVVAVIGPLGLGLRGRTSPLAWTGRARRLGAVVGGLVGTVALGAASIGAVGVIVALPFLVPVFVDLALLVTRRFEQRQGEHWVRGAAEALQRVGPTVVAITGSYGKTTTKNLVAHLLRDARSVVASPASFNNRMGLARAINENLSDGTEIFVAEMGTYGPGEIADLCRWIPPDVAVITALGPVHLERMGSIENIARAKREILEAAPVAVVSVDHPLLRDIVAGEKSRREVITVSGESRDDATVSAAGDGRVRVAGREIGRFPVDAAHPGNVAAAIGVCLALRVDPETFAARLADLPSVPHRRTRGRSERGFEIIDDTFNANPAGASAALDLLTRLGAPQGRKVVVTPGMVELGAEQESANAAFAAEAGRRGVTDFVVVNRTNRRALVTGAQAGGVRSVILFDTRDEAVRWVRGNLGAGDAVLYENDLPDHYP